MNNQINVTAIGEANVLLIKRIYDAFEKRDFPAFFNILDPRINILQCPELPFGGSYDGIPGATEFFGKVRSFLDSYVTIEQIINAGDRIVVIGRTYGTVNSNAAAFDVPIIHLWGFENGLANRLEIALDIPTMQAALNKN